MPQLVAHHWLLFLLAGIVGGIFSATFGVGGGALLVPALVLLFGFAQKSAQGMCLAMMVPMALVGAWRYHQNPKITLVPAVVLWLAIGSVVGAYIGAGIAGWASGVVLRRLFAVILLFVAWQMFFAKPRDENIGEIDSAPTSAPADSSSTASDAAPSPDP